MKKRLVLGYILVVCLMCVKVILKRDATSDAIALLAFIPVYGILHIPCVKKHLSRVASWIDRIASWIDNIGKASVSKRFYKNRAEDTSDAERKGE